MLASRFVSIQMIALDSQGNLYIGDYQALRFASSTEVFTLAGATNFGSGESKDGLGYVATFGLIDGPVAFVFDDPSVIYIADFGANTIRAVQCERGYKLVFGTCSM